MQTEYININSHTCRFIGCVCRPENTDRTGSTDSILTDRNSRRVVTASVDTDTHTSVNSMDTFSIEDTWILINSRCHLKRVIFILYTTSANTKQTANASIMIA